MLHLRDIITTEDELYRMIADELFAAARPIVGDRVGVELELLPLSREGAMLPMHGARGIAAWLASVCESEGWSFRDDPSGAIEARTRNGGTITVEPAGQIEYSGPPLDDASRAIDDLERSVDTLELHADRWGIRLVAAGYNTFVPERSMRLQVSKPRYRIMSRYFDSIGPFGRRMMRGTCALQINLDLGRPHQVAPRWRLANMIAPSLNALFANSPHVYRGRSYRSFRHEIWRRLDPSRTGRLYDRPDLDPVADYLRFALDARVMMIAGENGVVPAPDERTFRAWLRSPGVRPPTREDWRLHLSTLFPDVRARGWMEIRSIDSLPRPQRALAIMLTTQLIYDDDLRDAALDLLEARERICVPHDEHDGCWSSDLATGRELLGMAMPHM